MPAAKKAAKKSSPKKAAAARANGAKGGRPKKAMETGFGDLQPPPMKSGPLALHRWAKEVAAQLVWMDITKQITPGRASSIRNNIRTLIAAMPLDISAEVHKLLLEEQEMLSGDAGPDTVSADSLEDDDGTNKPTRSIAG